MSTRKLVVFCEGPTEQRFCSQTLRPYLLPSEGHDLFTLAVGRKDDHHTFGLGANPVYHRLRKFIQNQLKAMRGRDYRFTTFIDLYALPTDFPGLSSTQKNPANPLAYVESLEEAFGQDIDDWRFLPYLQLHEFETLLFVNPEAFATTFEGVQTEVRQLQAIARSFSTVEHIDDGPTTAPSKRIIEILPSFRGRKASAGPIIADHIGLPAMRDACPHFDSWIRRLETIEW